MNPIQLKLLVDSYGLDYLCELNDIEPTYVLSLLVDQGLIDLTELTELYEETEE